MDFINNHLGEFAALLTAFFWTVTSLAFETASHKIGSVAVNILRLIIGFAFLSAFNLVMRGLILPVDASKENWMWLSVPVFIILPAVVLYMQKVTFPEIFGAIISVAGVALFFL